MGERHFRLLIGIVLLTILYLDLDSTMWALVGLLFWEGITNWRLPLLVSRWRYGVDEPITQSIITGEYKPDIAHSRCGFEAERVLRLFTASCLFLSYFSYNEYLWPFPWFCGFTLVSAGLSGICPLVSFFKKLGFR